MIQRFGGALNLNIHFHTLAVDGVFVREPDGSLSFAAAKTPTDDEVEALLGVIRTRVLRLLVRRGLLCEEGGESLDETEHRLYTRSMPPPSANGSRSEDAQAQQSFVWEAHGRPRRLNPIAADRRVSAASIFMPTPQSAPRTGPRLERLCRYLLRPPVAEDRLSFTSDGRVLVRLKTPWRDGTDHIALGPQELLEKLAALIPRPYVNLIVLSWGPRAER